MPKQNEKTKFSKRTLALCVEMFSKLGLENWPAKIEKISTDKKGVKIQIRIPTQKTEGGYLRDAIKEFLKDREDGNEILIVPMYRWLDHMCDEHPELKAEIGLVSLKEAAKEEETTESGEGYIA